MGEGGPTAPKVWKDSVRKNTGKGPHSPRESCGWNAEVEGAVRAKAGHWGPL